VTTHPSDDPDQLKAARVRDWELVATTLAARPGTTIFTVTATVGFALLDAVRAGPGVRLLDVACGPGEWVPLVLSRGVDLVATDYASGMVEECRRNNPGVTAQVADAEALPFGDKEFDAVTCNFGVQMLPRPGSAVAEALRVLRPGGHFGFTTFCDSDAEDDLFRLVQAAIAAHRPDAPAPRAFWSAADCERILRERGFADVTARVIVLRAEMERPEQVLDIVDTAGRSRVFLSSLSPEVRRRIDGEMVDAAARHPIDGGACALSVPCILVRGTRPGS